MSIRKSSPVCDWCRTSERLCWPGNIPLLAFTTKLARKWLTNSDTSIDLHGTKWRDQLPRTITFDWRNTWHKKRSQKDGAFIWSLHRKAIAGNVWRSKVSTRIWQCLQDHGKIEGNPLKQMLPDDGAAPDFCFEHFDTTWGSNCVLCTRMNNSIRWHHNSIRHGSIFSTHPHNAGLYYTSIRVTSPVKTQAGVLLTLAQPGSV
ncbi:uncharacterized protein [Physcomitrium patens]|uniref:uncharacterized protein n=1 Tax=Physcomitrium patens TaxID=3218 RepID=UPI003CCE0007